MPMRDFFVPEKTGVRFEDCYFYHTVDLPGVGTQKGEWDLRGKAREYFGGIAFAGKRVLECGTASGGLCFELERLGAEVVGFDLSPEHHWDLVPFAGLITAERSDDSRRHHIGRINNAWWFTRRAVGSRANLVHGTIYQPPTTEPEFDVVTLGSILLHLRDPILALTNAARLSRDTLVVTDVAVPPGQESRMGETGLLFLPDPETRQPYETWWLFSERFIVRLLRILGFREIGVTRHVQQARHGPMNLFTVVARR